MRLDTSIAEITGRGPFYEPWRRRPAIARRRRHPLAHGIVKRRYRRLAQPRPDQTSGRMVSHSEAMMELLVSGGGSPAPVSLRVAVPKRRCGKASAMGTG